MQIWRSILGAALLLVTMLAVPLEAQEAPANIYGELFQQVQTERIFPDSKTFADAVPQRDPAAIMTDYRRTSPATRAALEDFILANFVVPGVNDRGTDTLRRHIRALWPMLVREPDVPAPGGSLLPMAERYVVPGGRFREMYYWDSYFTMLGLSAAAN